MAFITKRCFFFSILWQLRLPWMMSAACISEIPFIIYSITSYKWMEYIEKRVDIAHHQFQQLHLRISTFNYITHI